MRSATGKEEPETLYFSSLGYYIFQSLYVAHTGDARNVRVLQVCVAKERLLKRGPGSRRIVPGVLSVIKDMKLKRVESDLRLYCYEVPLRVVHEGMGFAPKW